MDTVTLVMQNRGRGSSNILKHHIQTFLKNGYKVNLVCPHDCEIHDPNFQWVQVDLGDLPVPVHEHLPSASEQKPASEMTYDEAMNYIERYKQAIAKVGEETDIFIGHHGNISSIALYHYCKENNRDYQILEYGTGIEGYIRNKNRDGRLFDEIKQMLEHSETLYVITPYVREHLVGPYISEAKKNKVKIIPLAVDEWLKGMKDNEVMDKYDLKPKKFILYVGALIETKGADALAQASKIYGDQMETVFVGRGPLTDQLEEMGVSCKILGFQSDAAKATLMKNAYLVVVPTLLKAEHFGLTAIEPWLFGTPTVAFNHGGPADIIQEGVNGFLVEDLSVKGLGNKLKAIIDNPERVEAIDTDAMYRYLIANYGQKYVEKYLINEIQSLLTHESAREFKPKVS
ncbi:MAG: glycosyltransferase family 4 protein [Candidatus Dojkabacteria bacterium]